jgi:hypothetical protein
MRVHRAERMPWPSEDSLRPFPVECCRRIARAVRTRNLVDDRGEVFDSASTLLDDSLQMIEFGRTHGHPCSVTLDLDHPHNTREKGVTASRGAGSSATTAAPTTGRSTHRNPTDSLQSRRRLGEIGLDTPRDRAGTFEPRLVPKGSRRLGGLDEQIISLYAGCPRHPAPPGPHRRPRR